MNIEFLTVAKEYCLLVENCGRYSRSDFKKVASRMLGYLYVRASVLNIKEEDYFLDGELSEAVDEFTYQNIWDSLSDALGSNDEYIRLEDVRRNDEVMQASISEDMADIYQSLKNYCASCEMGIDEISHDAELKVYEDFKGYWGLHLCNALTALHNLIYSTDSIDDDAVDDNEYSTEQEDV
ncbi:MAG: DUF5063 domain-containing protein [Marinilabiliaceae bacterium]|nr:DUF5063 domain-containing protein [Marinilabiliaceae bacterium]